MPPNSRAKGKRGERQVAALLARWWGAVEDGVQFVPTPQSGGFSTKQVRAEFKLAGDLMTTSRVFPYVVEVKHREKWSEARLRDGRRSPVWGWWRQVQEAAEVQGGTPMLWFRHNREPWLVMIPQADLLALRLPIEMRWHEFGRGADPGKIWPVVVRVDSLLAFDAHEFESRSA